MQNLIATPGLCSAYTFGMPAAGWQAATYASTSFTPCTAAARHRTSYCYVLVVLQVTCILPVRRRVAGLYRCQHILNAAHGCGMPIKSLNYDFFMLPGCMPS